MKSTRSRTLLAILAVACAGAIAAAAAVLAPVERMARAAYSAVRSFVLHGFALAPLPAPVVREPVVLLVQAKEFAQRLAKRERPTVTPGWRMCPST